MAQLTSDEVRHIAKLSKLNLTEEEIKKFQDQLSKTHALTYQYEFVWENWKLRK